MTWTLVLLQGGGGTPSTGQPLDAAWTDYLPVGAIDPAELDAVLLGWGRLVGASGLVSSAARGYSTGPAVPEPGALLLLTAASIAALVQSLVRPSSQNG